MQALITAGAGFLTAVLWFDLMFDVQLRPCRADVEVPDAVIASIAGYYRRVTTDARPRNLLVAAVMLATLAAIAAQMIRDDTPRWVSGVSLVLAAGPIGLAMARTVPNAVRLGGRTDAAAHQTQLARRVYRDHQLCIASISTLLVVQLGLA